jgi:predicted DNA-binding antitoxin AbrB/MazE fold protein
MIQQIDAVYENGLLRPSQSLRLAEHERVRITVVTDDDDELLDDNFDGRRHRRTSGRVLTVANYFDTSALCRHYHSEPGSEEVDQVLADDAATQYVSWLTVLEMQSAFALKVRTGAINEANLATLRSRLFADIDRKRLLVVRVLRRHLVESL